MTWHILCLRTPSDPFRPVVGPMDQVIEVPVGVPGHPQSVHNSIASVLRQHGLVLHQSTEDLLVAAISAYAADMRVPRRYAYDRWTRDFVLHLPVHQLAQWQQAQPALERLLAFLTGDHWTIRWRQLLGNASENTLAPVESPEQIRPPLRAKQVCLYSGGLDSFIGALDQLGQNSPVILVGHHGSGQGPTSIAQHDAMTALRRRYGSNVAPFLQFWVSPPKIALGVSEITARGRSILFLALGIAVADAVQANQLIVPENGFISLNVPLTQTRIGSFSTRTTHPYLMHRLREVLQAVGIRVEITLPYRFQTKGEMLTGCADQSTLRAGIVDTMSCAHPGAGRFFDQKNPYQHCGYCLPCLVRRAAIDSFMSDPTGYRVEGLHDLESRDLRSPTKRSDLRACKLALNRFHTRPPRLADVLLGGPLPGSEEELHAYLDTFRRGLAELERFLSRVA